MKTKRNILMFMSVLLITVFLFAGCNIEDDSAVDVSPPNNSQPSDSLPAPTNLKAVTSTNSSGNTIVTISWTPVTGALYYVIYCSTESTWTNYNIVSTNTTTTVYSYPYYSSDLPFETNKVYFYKIGAKGKYTNDPVGFLSETVEVYIGLAGASGISATAISDSIINIKWNAVSGAAKYRIYRGNSSSVTSMESVADVDVPTFNDISLVSGTSYYYRVSSVNDEEREGPLSSAYAYATTKAAPSPDPTPPANLRATAHGRGISLEWDAVPNVNYYYLYGSFSENGPYSLLYTLNASNGSAYNLGFGTGLLASTTYYFKISTIQNGPTTDAVSATTGP